MGSSRARTIPVWRGPARYRSTTFDTGTRTLTLTNGYTTINNYTGVLSADGKSLAQGKWTETKSADANKGPFRSGTWPAKLTQ